MNNVVLVGRLTRDPELSYTPNTQNAVCRFDIAISRPRRNGEDQGADYPRIVVWGRQAENCDRYLSKGSQVAVQGRIQTGSYTNKEGQKVFTTEVVANNVEFLSTRGERAGQSEQPSFGGGARESAPAFDDSNATQTTSDFAGFDDMPDTFQAAEDDIPF